MEREERDDSPDWLHQYQGPSKTFLGSDSSPSSSPSRSKRGGHLQRKGLQKQDHGVEASSLYNKSDDAENTLQIISLDDTDEDIPENRLRARGNDKEVASSPEASGKGMLTSAKARKSLAARGSIHMNADEDEKLAAVKAVHSKKKRLRANVLESDDDEMEPIESKRKCSKVTEIEGNPAKRVAKGEPQKDEVDDTDSEPLLGLLNGGGETLSNPSGSDGSKQVGKKKAQGAAALPALAEDIASLSQDVASQSQQGVGQDETGEAQERRVKPRVASTLPLVFAEKIHKSKVLVECEGDALDLSGDMGAVGRFSVSAGQAKSENGLLLDLKGVIYKTTIVPSNTFFVVNVGQAEAKVEAIMNDFVQLHADADHNELESMVEGTLEGFSFDSDEEGERPAPAAATNKDAPEDSDDGATPSKQMKTSTKTGKAGKGKSLAKKTAAGKGKASRGKGKAVPKGGGGKKTAAKKTSKPSVTKKPKGKV